MISLPEFDQQHLYLTWWSLAEVIDVPLPLADEIWQEIVLRYGENGRFYHTLSHIQHVMGVAEQLQDAAQEWTAVQAAIWFHDIIYDPKRIDNETQSANYAAQQLGECKAINLDKVQRLILATKSHLAPQDVDYYILLDADLAILAADSQQYAKYAQAIRQEFAFVPEDAYVNGRLHILKQFLNRSQIYYTPQLHNSFDAAARQNIQVEINHLQTLS
jgi:predicted metal-dependent HD superfamily phosphohydrolase